MGRGSDAGGRVNYLPCDARCVYAATPIEVCRCTRCLGAHHGSLPRPVALQQGEMFDECGAPSTQETQTAARGRSGRGQESDAHGAAAWRSEQPVAGVVATNGETEPSRCAPATRPAVVPERHEASPASATSLQPISAGELRAVASRCDLHRTGEPSSPTPARGRVSGSQPQASFDLSHLEEVSHGVPGSPSDPGAGDLQVVQRSEHGPATSQAEAAPTAATVVHPNMPNVNGEGVAAPPAPRRQTCGAGLATLINRQAAEAAAARLSAAPPEARCAVCHHYLRRVGSPTCARCVA